MGRAIFRCVKIRFIFYLHYELRQVPRTLETIKKELYVPVLSTHIYHRKHNGSKTGVK